MKNKINKFIHSKYLLISLIILLILLVMATGTYAWFTWRSTSNTSLTMNIGKLADVTFNSGNDISTSTLAPVYNYTDGEKTTFSINNKDTTGASLDYNIKLNITSIASELKSSDLKYVLLKDNTIVKEGNFSSITTGSTTIYSDSISSSGTTNFIFYLYIDGNEENDLNMMNKSLSGTLTVEGSEVELETLYSHIENLMSDGDMTTVTNNSIDYDYNTTNYLMNDSFDNIRYYGASPNNYIYFNCDDYSNQSANTCEVWRIIGEFNNLETNHVVKIIRNDSIGNFSLDTTMSTDSFWNLPLVNILNIMADPSESHAFYHARNSGKCDNVNNEGTCDFTTTGLKNDLTRDLIYRASLYSFDLLEGDKFPQEVYENEIANGTYAGLNVTLMYESDYAYAANFEFCTVQLSGYNIEECTKNNWLFNNQKELIMSATTNINSNIDVIIETGVVGQITIADKANVRPTLYLRNDIKLKKGTGTRSDPYQLQVS